MGYVHVYIYVLIIFYHIYDMLCVIATITNALGLSASRE